MASAEPPKGFAWLRRLDVLTRYLPEVNFISLHYAYFILMSLIVGLIFWGSSTPARSVSFTDSLFLISSAMTEAGLNTVNLSSLNTWQQIILFFMILAGSSIFVSIAVIFVRLRAFEKAFHDAIQDKRRERQKQQREAGAISRTQSFLHHRRAVPLEKMDNANGAEKKAEEGRVTGEHQTSKENHSNDSSAAESSGSDIHNGLRLDGAKNDEKEDDGVRERVIRFEVTSPSPHLPAKEWEAAPPPPGPEPGLLRVGTGHSRDSHGSRISRNAGNAPERMKHPLFTFNGVGASANATLRLRTDSADSNPASPKLMLPRVDTVAEITGQPTTPYFQSTAGFFTRNSQVNGLTMEERERLGGCEYSAIFFLAVIVPLYFVIWQLLGCLACGAWLYSKRPYVARDNGSNPFWAGAFLAVSGFNNSGMSLIDANMIPFQDAVYFLLTMALLILAGNTCYPIFLRMAIWTLWKLIPNTKAWSHDKATLRFLLDHPRRCYTNLFPSPHTWWLGFTVFTLNAVDWAAFEILNVRNRVITRPFSTGIEVLDGFFQAVAVRSGGFIVVSIPTLAISLQVLYVLMMYIGVYPVAMSIRSSNVYEERSLGIFAEEQPANDDDFAPPTKTASDDFRAGRIGTLKRRVTAAARANRRERGTKFLRHQLRNQLGHDAWFLAIAVFIIMIIEGGRFQSDPINYSVFNVLFEVVSGYGCVGISVGLPYASYSFSGGFHTLSKLVMIVVMIRGRHRGLPVAIDHAVQLPGRRLGQAEEEDGKLRRAKTFLLGSVPSG